MLERVWVLRVNYHLATIAPHKFCQNFAHEFDLRVCLSNAQVSQRYESYASTNLRRLSRGAKERDVASRATAVTNHKSNCARNISRNGVVQLGSHADL